MTEWADFRMWFQLLFAVFAKICSCCSAVDALSGKEEVYEAHSWSIVV
jgi:flagellar biosynthesis regulator FlbT